MLKDEEI
jgi:hypothetical protein